MFCNAFHIPITGEVRHYKFGGLVYHSTSQPVGDKPSLKRAWSGHVTNFRILHPTKYLRNG